MNPLVTQRHHQAASLLWRLCWCFLALLVAGENSRAQDRLEVGDPNGEGWFAIGGFVPSDTENKQVYEIQTSTDLRNWSISASVHHWPFHFEDPGTPQNAIRYYQLDTRRRSSSDDWKNLLTIEGRSADGRFIQEPFLAFPVGSTAGAPRWAKFAIVIDDPHKVVYQNSRTYTFHYDFAKKTAP